MVAVFVLAGNTLLRPLVDWLNRRPLTEGFAEAQYRVLAVCSRNDVSDVRDLMEEVLTRTHYPVREIEIESESENQIELAAHLVPTRVVPLELEQVVTELEKSPLVHSATWAVGTRA